jgi:hypothetical protein
MKLHWGNSIVLFFIGFLSLGAFFIVFSLKQNNDLTDENYYEKGAGYSKQIEINKRSVVFNDSVTIKTINNTLQFYFCNTIQKKSETVLVHFYRPSSKDYDYHTSFNMNDSVYSIEKTRLVEGRYIVKITWNMDDDPYALAKDLMVKQPSTENIKKSNYKKQTQIIY